MIVPMVVDGRITNALGQDWQACSTGVPKGPRSSLIFEEVPKLGRRNSRASLGQVARQERPPH